MRLPIPLNLFPYKLRYIHALPLALLSAGLMFGGTLAQAAEPYSPYASTTQSTEKRVLWGDTHLHTVLSLDARAFGVELDQETAYRFARGEQVTSTHGEAVKLSRPLDFLVVSDHSDAMGTMHEVIAGNPDFIKDKKVNEWYQKLNSDASNAEKLTARMEVMGALTSGQAPEVLFDRDFFAKTWNNYLAKADDFNQPGQFTTIIGYEWTSSPSGSNLHRNVLYRDGADRAKQALPLTAGESENPEDLWKWMESYEKKSQGQILAIAHNGNISNGIMFPEVNPATGKPLNENYAKTRARWEPLYEVTQIKGDGETHSYLSPNDEFADFETWDSANFAGTPKTKEMLTYEYARDALGRGLELEKMLGSNPYKFGMIGSTDSHTGLATGEEDNFFGKLSYMEPSPTRWKGLLGDVNGNKTYGWQMTGSGYAAVWATENTREAIFDAMMRKETYATSGPRMVVKFNAELDGVSVPMGGSLNAKPKSIGPKFSLNAWKDPLGANLDRIQIVKGWVDRNGESQELVIDVAWSGERSKDEQGKLAPVGNTVNIETASYENTIGEAQLSAHWTDPNFDSRESAFYYARVLEIPTPRWTAYDALRFNVEMSDNVPMVMQERAYTSPIWVQP